MSKMMAIIDEPECCMGCKLCSSRSGKGFRCNLTGRYMDSIDLTKRPDWCELREIPEKKSEWGGGCVEDNHGEVEWKEEKMINIECKNVKMKKICVDKMEGNEFYYLTVVYEGEDKDGNFHECTIPKIRLPFRDNEMPKIVVHSCAPSLIRQELFAYILLDDNKLPIDRASDTVKDGYGNVIRYDEALVVDVVKKWVKENDSERSGENSDTRLI